MSVYKDEKHKTWYAVFRYTNWQGKRVQTFKRGFARKKDAENYEEETRRAAEGAPDMTMKSLCDLYIEDLKARRKKTTVYGETCMINRHITPYLGDMPINQITVTTIREWQNKVMSTKSATSNRLLSPHTLRNISVCLSSILNYAVRFHGLARNPVQVAKGMGHATSHVDFWEANEYERFREAIDNENDKLFFDVLFKSGMRLGEFLALTTDDFDFTANKITINKTYNWKLKYVSPPKTETSIRTISMPKSVMDDIKKYLDRFYGGRLGRVFAITSDKILANRLTRFAKIAGVKRIRIHDLRHSHASYLIHNNVPVTAIAKRLGHKSPKVTLDVYSHVYEQSDKEIINLLEKI